MPFTADKSLNELLQCSLCSLRYSEPRVLPCQHTFCTQCLAKYYDARQVSSQRKIAAIPCPTCKAIALVPRQGVAAFPVDHKISKVKELVDYMMTQSALNKCKISPEEVKRDNDTLINRATDGHEPAAELIGGKRNTTDNCNATGTERTSPERHVDCHQSPADDNDVFGSCETSTHCDEGNFTRGSNGRPATSGSETHSACRENNGEPLFNFRRFHSSNRRRTVSPEWSAAVGDPADVDDGVRSQTGDDGRQDTAATPDRRPSQPDDGPTGCVNAPDQQQFSRKSPVKRTRKRRRNDVTSETSDATAEGEPLSPTVENDKNNVHNHSDNNNNCFQPDSPTCRLQTSHAADESNFDEDANSSVKLVWQVERTDYRMPTGVVFLHDDRLVVAEYGHNKLEYYDREGRLVCNAGDLKPFGVTVNSLGEVIVMDRKDQTVKLYDREAQPVYNMDKEKFSWSSGIAVNSRGQYVLCDRHKCKIGMYNNTGEFILEFGSYGKGDTQLCMADFITIDSHDRIVVCDSGNHCVKIFDDNGRFLSKCGGRGCGDGQMLWPKGVCVDSSDNIFVCDTRNDRISMYNSDGCFVKNVLTCARPFAIAYTAPNCLGVTRYSLSGKSSIVVYAM